MIPSSPRLRRGVTLGLLTGLLSIATAGMAATAGIQVPGSATHQLAVLLRTRRAYRMPNADSREVGLLAARRPITGEETTVPVVGHSTGANGVRWLRVMLPGRPDGSTGWIAAQGTRKLSTSWYLAVDLALRSVSAYRDAHLKRTFRAVVGKPSTPTPTGSFFVEEAVRLQMGEPGGPFALALSARSNALQEFEGGPGQIALHGRENLGGTLGTAASHGCIRLDTAAIDWLAARIRPGTPVTIYR